MGLNLRRLFHMRQAWFRIHVPVAHDSCQDPLPKCLARFRMLRITAGQSLDNVGGGGHRVPQAVRKQGQQSVDIHGFDCATQSF